MARKSQKAPEENKKPAPVISKLPIPISDSPLVIDLPDGQKLVVGRMIQGTVIEVATWRGTGRPDSRTSRLMLGMSIDDVKAPKDEPITAEPKTVDFAEAENSASQKKRNPLSEVTATVKGVWAKVWGESTPKKPRRTSKFGRAGFAASGASVASAPVSRGAARGDSSSSSDEIAVWLEEISEKARVKVSTRIASSTAKKSTRTKPASSSRAASSKKTVKKSPSRTTRRK